MISFGIFVCLFVALIYALTISPEPLDNKALSKKEPPTEIGLLTFLQIIIVEKLKDLNEVVNIKTDNKESIIIETSLNSLDTIRHIEVIEEIYSELKIMNKQNGIKAINYKVLLKTEDGIVVGELKFGNHPLP